MGPRNEKKRIQDSRRLVNESRRRSSTLSTRDKRRLLIVLNCGSFPLQLQQVRWSLVFWIATTSSGGDELRRRKILRRSGSEDQGDHCGYHWRNERFSWRPDRTSTCRSACRLERPSCKASEVTKRSWWRAESLPAGQESISDDFRPWVWTSWPWRIWWVWRFLQGAWHCLREVFRVQTCRPLLRPFRPFLRPFRPFLRPFRPFRQISLRSHCWGRELSEKNAYFKFKTFSVA